MEGALSTSSDNVRSVDMFKEHEGDMNINCSVSYFIVRDDWKENEGRATSPLLLIMCFGSYFSKKWRATSPFVF